MAKLRTKFDMARTPPRMQMKRANLLFQKSHNFSNIPNIMALLSKSKIKSELILPQHERGPGVIIHLCRISLDILYTFR